MSVIFINFISHLKENPKHFVNVSSDKCFATICAHSNNMYNNGEKTKKFQNRTKLHSVIKMLTSVTIIQWNVCKM